MKNKIIFVLQKIANILCDKVENSKTKKQIESWLFIGLSYNSFLVDRFDIYLD